MINIKDKRRHPQFSTVKDLRMIPFGFNFDEASGLIAADGNINPPQLFTEVVATDEFTLICPKGNPEKCWAIAWASDDLVAHVANYSTVKDGELTIALAAEPAADSVTTIQGVLFYGGVAKEGRGAVAAAPTPARGLKSHAQTQVRALVRDLTVWPVGWTSDGSGNVTETRGPLGTTVERTGIGEYTITLPVNLPYQWETLYAKLQGASDGRNADFAYGTGAELVMTFADGANMGNGERASVFLFGPASDYPANYGGASGGVHASPSVRDFKNHASYESLGFIRGGVLVPFHATIATGTAGPTEATSNLPAGMRLRRTGAGAYELYVGKLPAGGLIAETVRLSSGAAIGITAVNEDTGVITMVAPGGDPGATVLTGLLYLKHQSFD